MKKVILPIATIVVVALAIALLSSCDKVAEENLAPEIVVATDAVEQVMAQEEREYLFEVMIHSEAIAQNMIDENAERKVYISVPPSYYDSNKSYPVVYFLEGYEDRAAKIISRYADLGEQMQEPNMTEIILVNVDGYNKFLGSFYANSPVTGNWGDFITQELVDYVDSNFRTIKKSSARGIAGFSMGGSGAVNIALEHPDVFSCMYALSPGLFDENGLINAIPTWSGMRNFMDGYGAAFSPNLEAEFPHMNMPLFDGTEEDNKIVADWEKGFGNLDEKLNNYLEMPNKLNGIKIEVGSNDWYSWIPQGCAYFSELLSSHDIEHEYVESEGNHSIPKDFFDNDWIEFFSKHLEHE